MRSIPDSELDEEDLTDICVWKKSKLKHLVVIYSLRNNLAATGATVGKNSLLNFAFNYIRISTETNQTQFQ